MSFFKNKKALGDILICLLLFSLFAWDVLSYPEYKLQDLVYQQVSLTDPNIYVIGIDEKALSEEGFGPYSQWSRQIMADAVNRLNSDPENKPAVIVIDSIYSGEDKDQEADANLAQAVADGGNVVMGSLLVISNQKIFDYTRPYSALEESASYGMVNSIIDDDAVVRRAILKAQYEEEVIYSLTYEAYKIYTGETLDFIENPAKPVVETYIAYTGEPGDYYGTSGYGYSFADIFDEDFEPDFFADGVIFIGAYAAALSDAYHTPVSGMTQMYGVEIHANIFEMLINENFKEYAPFQVNGAVLLGFLILAMFLARKIDIRILVAVFLAMGAAYVALSWYMFGKGYILLLIYPLLSLAIIYVYQLVFQYILGTMEQKRIRNAFKKYVDPKLVDQLIESGEANSNEVGVKRHIAVLFVDVRGFTPMSEALKDSPETVVRILNEYLEMTSSAVFNNGGSVDKFIGDATMALFNGFVPLEDYIYKAVKAAWDMVSGSAGINATLKEKYGVDVGFGIGVHCGEAIVGNLGPSFRKDYTAIGDTVNTAARLESNAKRSQVLISRSVADALGDRIVAESVGEIPLKGKSIPIEVFSITGLKE